MAQEDRQHQELQQRASHFRCSYGVRRRLRRLRCNVRRPSKYAVIPYFEFALAEGDVTLEIEEIVVGPNPDASQAKESVRYLISCRGATCKRIENYSGTYRNW